MELLRKSDNPEYKNTVAIMGYGPEDRSTVLELTYNYGVTEYNKGNGYAQIATGTNDVYKTAKAIKKFGGVITLEPGPLPILNTKITACLDPDGWKSGKYYCDYCDKEFQDTAYARKRHLQGVQHQRAKSLWYHSLRANQINPSGDPFPTLGVCNRFVTTGSCPYGDSCKYLHPKQNPQSTTTPGTTVTNFTDNTQSLDMMERQQAGGASLQGNILRDGLGISLGNLPPSLKPPPEGGYSSLPFVDWG